MTKPVMFVKADENLKKAIKELEKYGLSQLPVISNGKQLGSISERSILLKINKSPGIDIEKTKAEEVMEEALPTIQPNTPLSVPPY